MSKYIDIDELHKQGWVAARFTNWEPTPLNGNFRLEAEVKPFITFPAADVAEVKHGRWIDFHCSVCGKVGWSDEDDYCPNCGAKMDEVGDGN